MLDLAQTFFSGNLEEFLPKTSYAGITMKEYMQAHQQQIPIAFLYSLCFQVMRFPTRYLLRILNVFLNGAIVIGVFKITKQLSKKYKTNNVLAVVFILTFMSLPLLTTFVYGDTPSLALCLFSVYFTMRYRENNRIKYIVLSISCMAVAYMFRMNSLIFIIATVIYLGLSVFEDRKEKKLRGNLISLGVIVAFILVSIVPSEIITNYYLNKYDMDKTKACPKSAYLLLAMEEGPRANGWYIESITEPALREPEVKAKEYPEMIKDRLAYFAKNPGYAFEFYRMKIASMWTENTYSGIRNNTYDGESPLENLIKPLTFYQKMQLILTATCTLVILIQNRKKLSLEILFLVTIFIGGFAFHVLWEGKSRYIIPYVVILIPISAIKINRLEFTKKIKLIKTKSY